MNRIRLLTSLVLLSLAAPFASAYTFRGAKLAGASLQPSVEFTLGNAYATVWSNQPVSRERDTEVDFTFSLNGSAGALDVDLGLTAYRYPGGGATTWEPYLGLSREVLGIKVAATGFYDATLRAHTYQLGLSREIKVAKRLTLTPRLTAGIARAAGDSTTYYEGAIEGAFALTERASAFGAVAFTSTDDRSIERDIRSFSAGVRVSF